MRSLFCAGFGLLCVLPAMAASAAPAATQVTFYRDIAPIVYGNAACHRPGESCSVSAPYLRGRQKARLADRRCHKPR